MLLPTYQRSLLQRVCREHSRWAPDALLRESEDRGERDLTVDEGEQPAIPYLNIGLHSIELDGSEDIQAII